VFGSLGKINRKKVKETVGAREVINLNYRFMTKMERIEYVRKIKYKSNGNVLNLFHKTKRKNLTRGCNTGMFLTLNHQKKYSYLI